MGNICRSPSAEGFFANALQDSAYKDLISIDSAGTHSYHVGYEPDSRAIDMAAHFGVEIGHLRARKVKTADFQNFDLIIAMDAQNLIDIEALRPSNNRTPVHLFLDFGDHPVSDVPDPYYTRDFDGALDLIEAASTVLHRALR